MPITVKQLQEAAKNDKRDTQAVMREGLASIQKSFASIFEPKDAGPVVLPSGLTAEVRAMEQAAHLRRQVEGLHKALEAQQAKADADARRYFWLSTAVAILGVVAGWFLASFNAIQLVFGLLHR